MVVVLLQVLHFHGVFPVTTTLLFAFLDCVKIPCQLGGFSVSRLIYLSMDTWMVILHHWRWDWNFARIK